MATATGTYTDLHDFINKLQVFAAANGWTVNKFNLGSGTISNTEAYLQNGSQYVNIRGKITNTTVTRYNASILTDYPELEAWGSTGFNGGSAIDAQPGTSAGVVTKVDWIVSPGLGYWFFSDGSTYVHAVAETVANEFEHFVFGEMDKAGSYTGGNYIDGTYWQQGASTVADEDDVAHSVCFDSLNGTAARVGMVYVSGPAGETFNGWRRLAGSSNGAQIVGDEGQIIGSVRNKQPFWPFIGFSTPNDFNDASPLFPIHLFLVRSSDLISPLGTVKDVRYLNIQNFTPKDTITLGSDTYQLFPITTKRSPTETATTAHNSGWQGYAYKIIP